MTETQTNWLDEELANRPTQFTGEKLPALKLETGKIVTITVDFTNPFNKWTGENSGKAVTKAIIPVLHKGEKKNFWLNVLNPLYREICERGKKGQTEFKIATTGAQGDTRYTISEEA